MCLLANNYTFLPLVIIEFYKNDISQTLVKISNTTVQPINFNNNMYSLKIYHNKLKQINSPISNKQKELL